MATKTATSTTKLYQNLGAGVRALVDATPATDTYESDAALGKQVAGLIAAALKATLPGSQRAKQVKPMQEQAQQAVARKLARIVKRLGTT